MSEFKIIETQEEFDAKIQERLKREKEKHETAIKELQDEVATLKLEVGQKNDALTKSQTDYEALQQSVAEKDEKIGRYEMAKMKTTIALQHGIPYDLADRLTGEDEAELTADAKRLSGFISNPAPIAPLKSTEPKGSKYEGREAALLRMSENLINKGE